AATFRRIWSIGPAGSAIPPTIARDGNLRRITIHSADRNDFLKKPRLHSSRRDAARWVARATRANETEPSMRAFASTQNPAARTRTASARGGRRTRLRPAVADWSAGSRSAAPGRVVDQAMRLPGAVVQRACTCGGEPDQLQRHPEGTAPPQGAI